MNLLHWNFANLILAIIAGVLSFNSATAEVAKGSQALFLVFLALFLAGLVAQSFRSAG